MNDFLFPVLMIGGLAGLGIFLAARDRRKREDTLIELIGEFFITGIGG